MVEHIAMLPAMLLAMLIRPSEWPVSASSRPSRVPQPPA
jgi:hypothetical protein